MAYHNSHASHPAYRRPRCRCRAGRRRSGIRTPPACSSRSTATKEKRLGYRLNYRFVHLQYLLHALRTIEGRHQGERLLEPEYPRSGHVIQPAIAGCSPICASRLLLDYYAINTLLYPSVSCNTFAP